MTSRSLPASSPTGQRGFEDLRFYQQALDLVRMSYALARKLPPEERYNMADQIKRSSTSVTNNIAEGYGRFHFADKLRFLFIARGSLDETLNIFITAHVVGYCEKDKVDDARQLVHSIHRGMNGYVNYIRKQRQGADVFGPTAFREDAPVYLVDQETGRLGD